MVQLIRNVIKRSILPQWSCGFNEIVMLWSQRKEETRSRIHMESKGTLTYLFWSKNNKSQRHSATDFQIYRSSSNVLLNIWLCVRKGSKQENIVNNIQIGKNKLYYRCLQEIRSHIERILESLWKILEAASAK